MKAFSFYVRPVSEELLLVVFFLSFVVNSDPVICLSCSGVLGERRITERETGKKEEVSVG